MINNCYITPNDIYIDLIEILTFTSLYLAYMSISLFRHSSLFSSHQRWILKSFAVIQILNTVVVLSLTIATYMFFEEMQDGNRRIKEEYRDLDAVFQHIRGLSYFLTSTSITLLFLLWLFSF